MFNVQVPGEAVVKLYGSTGDLWDSWPDETPFFDSSTLYDGCRFMVSKLDGVIDGVGSSIAAAQPVFANGYYFNWPTLAGRLVTIEGLISGDSRGAIVDAWTKFVYEAGQAAPRLWLDLVLTPDEEDQHLRRAHVRRSEQAPLFDWAGPCLARWSISFYMDCNEWVGETICVDDSCYREGKATWYSPEDRLVYENVFETYQQPLSSTYKFDGLAQQGQVASLNCFNVDSDIAPSQVELNLKSETQANKLTLIMQNKAPGTSSWTIIWRATVSTIYKGQWIRIDKNGNITVRKSNGNLYRDEGQIVYEGNAPGVLGPGDNRVAVYAGTVPSTDDAGKVGFKPAKACYTLRVA